MPFAGRSSDHQGIIDFLEAIEAQAEVECRDDEKGKRKLQLRLFRTHLRGDARDMMNMLTTSEHEDWEQIKKFYINKFKTERDQKAKQRAREPLASFKQQPDEHLRAYGERAVKLRELIDEGYEGVLVSRFIRGVRDKSMPQLLVIGHEDLSKVTIAQLN